MRGRASDIRTRCTSQDLGQGVCHAMTLAGSCLAFVPEVHTFLCGRERARMWDGQSGLRGWVAACAKSDFSAYEYMTSQVLLTFTLHPAPTLAHGPGACPGVH